MNEKKQMAGDRSGLEYLREMLKDWHGSAMAETLNFRLVAVDDGSAHAFAGVDAFQCHVDSLAQW